MSKTLSVRLNKKAEQALESLQEKTGKTQSEILREGIVLTELLEEERRQGKKLYVVDEENGDEKKEVVWT